MSSTIRIAEADKERLKRLQEFWHIAKRQEPSQEELVGKCLEYVEKHKDQFMVEAGWRPMTMEEFEAFSRRVQGHYGVWSSEDIDDIVYGGD